VFFIPFQLIRQRYLIPDRNKPPFIQRATIFQDFVIRCVRYAFANIPAQIGAVFFSKRVALPFFYFRMLRNRYLHCPIYWKEITIPATRGYQHLPELKGIYMIVDETRRPDFMVYYCHGGGFSMGSSYFYIEFLMAWITLLKASGKCSNPALVAPDYSLVPHATYPTQADQTLMGWKFVLSLMNDRAGRICVSGDSAGATLILSLLLFLPTNSERNELPGMAVLISPWITILSEQNRNTTSDYLDEDSLWLHGSQYLGKSIELGELHFENDSHPQSRLVSVLLHNLSRAMPKNLWDFDVPHSLFVLLIGPPRWGCFLSTALSGDCTP
jgi:acetyl esterase/lipase